MDIIYIYHMVVALVPKHTNVYVNTILTIVIRSDAFDLIFFFNSTSSKIFELSVYLFTCIYDL